MTSALSPGLLLVAGGLILPFLRGRVRDALVLAVPLLTLAAVLRMSDGVAGVAFLGFDLVPVRSDALSRLFAVIFSIMAFAGGLYALRQSRVLELGAAFVYAGSAIGVAFAGDWITVFVYWELMALGSTAVILSVGGERTGRVGARYFTMHMLGGAALLAGIIGVAVQTGSIAFEAMALETLSLDQWAPILILVGVLLNAAAPPLGAWLADAYPEASFSGTVFLSAFTTKTSVYVLLRGFPGADILIVVGLIMVFYGIIYALLENDMRRILAFSIVNQVGFMVTGVGIGTEMALNGAAAHAFAHIIYKALLLMSAGSVLYMTGKRKCTDLGGLFQSMPVTAVCGIIGALAISSFPFTSGFVSKSMISQSAGDEHLFVVWMFLMAASAGVFLHAGIKFPWFVFFQKDSGMRPPDPPANMQAAMLLFAALCILIGLWPAPLYELLPYPVDYVPYTVPHVLGALQLLLFSGLAFFLMLPLMKRTLTITLDADWLYRRLGAAAAARTLAQVARSRADVEAAVRACGDWLVRIGARFFGPDAGHALVGDTGRAIFMVLVILLISLVIGVVS